MRVASIALVALCIWSTYGFARIPTICGVLYVKSSGASKKTSIVKIHPSNGSINPMDLAKLGQVITQVNNVASLMQVPDEVFVELTMPSTTAVENLAIHFNHFEWNLHIPSLLNIKQLSESKQTTITHAIQAHEYAHLLFADNLGIEIPEYGKLYDHFRLIGKMHYDSRGMEVELQELTKQIQEAKDEQTSRNLVNKHYELSQAMADINERRVEMFSNSPDIGIDPSSDYSELFADLAAYLIFENPEEVIKLSYYYHDPLKYFSLKIPAKGWNVSNDLGHHSLAPAYSYIGQHILRSPTYSLLPKALILRKIFDILVMDIKTFRADPKAEELTIEEVNERLIKSLAKEFP